MFLLVTSTLLVNRINDFPPIKTSVKTTCTIINPNIYCEKTSVQDYVVLHGTSKQDQSEILNCHALLKYTTQSVYTPTLESVSYFPHSSTSSQHSYKEGEVVECFYDHLRPQIVSYYHTIVVEDKTTWYKVKEIGYVGLAACAILALTSVVCMFASCWCSFLYNREVRRYGNADVGVKEFPYSNG
ncbi:predicted protein [Naegleria gruberi]|uniref:Predicted protein n=1 Tax=Naegleria gruberi TaxID=5762 RepID=D2V8U0_NAEGR|nr:uncharacterized protein NAEGRDRAFT_65280 [Naegleria gruberi]EFC46751.1 predicted protein [Naegleria gruberi]|eukprot:XP_002679495.1 predicted protein [Naegleria gruberi strain NEG-M]